MTTTVIKTNKHEALEKLTDKILRPVTPIAAPILACLMVEPGDGEQVIREIGRGIKEKLPLRLTRETH